MGGGLLYLVGIAAATFLILNIQGPTERRRFASHVLALMDGLQWLSGELYCIAKGLWMRLRSSDSYQTEEWFAAQIWLTLREFRRGYQEATAEFRKALDA